MGKYAGENGVNIKGVNGCGKNGGMRKEEMDGYLNGGSCEEG